MEVRCADVGADTCNARFTAETQEELVRQLARHLREAHNVPTPTQTFMTYYLKQAS
ncbi:MAG: DUF1059 domain-containing protein [Actinobacteria bacterium]|nr:DUF1059 domain-containing protein [Actinomycetota bacterium]